MTDAESAAGPGEPHAPEARVPVFEKPPAIVRFFDQTEEAIRSRLAKMTFFERVFQLNRDWMTRITMLMVVASVFWGIVGAFDIFGWRTQVTAYALGQQLHLSNQEIYSSITLHGIRMLFGFAQQLELALFAIIFVTAFGITPRHKWAYYVSVVLINLSLVLMEGPFYLTPAFNDNYFPALGWYFYSPLGIRGLSLYVASPLWYVGWIALSVGVMIWAAWILVHFRDWWRDHKGQTRRLPPFALFVIALAILIPLSYVTVLVSSTWDLFNYFGMGPVNPLLNQVIFWFFGHGLVYILFLIPITAFYFLVPVFAKRPIYSYRAAVAAAVIFTILTPVLSIHHLYLTPVPPWSAWLTMALTFLIIIPSAITFFTVWMTMKGVKRKDWEWNAVTLFLLLSFAGSVAGGLTGPDNNTISFDIDLHNTMFILSHFHAMALLSITAGAFALTYALFPVLVGRFWYSPRLAQAHFVGSAIGWAGLVMFMDFLGTTGLLRRELIFQQTAGVVDDQIGLTVFVIITLLAQLFLAANLVLTVFFGRLVSAKGLSLDETIRAIAASTHPNPRVPIHDVPFARQVPRARRERVERTWVTVAAILIIAVLVAVAPSAWNAASGLSTPADPPAGTVWANMTGYQYYWQVQESGAISGTFANLLVVHAGEWVAVNATAVGATQGFYLPFRSLPVVNIEVPPDSETYALFQAPAQPGVYGMANAEYNGPWFGQDVGAMVVLPAGGGMTNLDAFASNGGAGDVYNPPVQNAVGASLTGDQEGLFDNSVPGPTLSATAGPVAFQWTVPVSSIGIDNYLVNITGTSQGTWLAEHNYTLPYDFGLYAVNSTATSSGSTVRLSTITAAPLRVGATETVSEDLPAGVYLYGLVSPIPYVYAPDPGPSWMTGSQEGNVMGLWGVLWVAP